MVDRMSERVILEPGMPAPDFSLPDQDGVVRRLADFHGTRLVMFFYPEAMTPACSMEACEFQESTAPFAEAGIAVVGVSRDAVERLRRFADRDGLEYPLLSDPDIAAHRAYGAYGTKNSYGRIIEGAIRSTFVVDAEGRIEQALYNVKATGHVARMRKLLAV